MSSPQVNEYENLNFHPYNIMMVLLMFGLSMLFLALSAAYVYSRTHHHLPSIEIPFLFVFNTLILAGSSYTLTLAKKSYLSDNTLQYQKYLGFTLFLSLAFMLLQLVAWQQMIGANHSMVSSNLAGYVWAISILHLLHVVGGIPFLVSFYYVAMKRMKEPISVLVYFSDPLKKLNLKLLTMYWHFLDILWIYLVIFFYINYLIK
ncbi:MAG: cytochrome c oxidase subunit 3 [Saprospiraceae bacterium]